MTGGYFDYVASAPPYPEALAAQAEAARMWFANPSSAHGPGRAARAELERLRGLLASRCGGGDGYLVWMSGATEANNWVVHGLMRAGTGRVLVAEDTHASVWNACRRYDRRMEVLSLDPRGRIPLASLAAALHRETCLFCCSHVANETGVIHDVGAMAALCERRGVPCLVDGAQAVGHVPVDLAAIGCDFYTFAAHKFGGPRGCGGVFLRSRRGSALLEGGGQEGGLRAGTENLPGMAGAVAALGRALSDMAVESGRLRELASRVLDAVRQSGLPCHVNGDPATGLPGFVSLSFPGADGHALVADLALQGYAVASGSACSEDRPEPSRAILALGRSPAEALGTVRIALGRLSRTEEVTAFAEALVSTVRRHVTRGSEP